MLDPNAKQHARPLWRGLLTAAVTPSLCLGLMALPSLRVDASAERVLLGVLVLAIAPTMIALVPLSLLGLPMILWLRGRGSLRVGWVCAGGGLIGAISFGCLVWSITWHHEAPEPRQILQGAAFGLASAGMFCLGAGVVWRAPRTRHDGDARQAMTEIESE